jgi:hypothetical protein
MLIMVTSGNFFVSLYSNFCLFETRFILSRIRGSVPNNCGFYIGWMDLTPLLQLHSIITVHTLNCFWIMNPSLLSGSCTSGLHEFCLTLRSSRKHTDSLPTHFLFFWLLPNRGHWVEQFSCLLSRKRHLHRAGNVCWTVQLSVIMKTSPLCRKCLSTLLWEQCLWSRCSTIDCSSWSSQIRVSTSHYLCNGFTCQYSHLSDLCIYV